jgi:nitrite reductase/ring-hydroxylating ferredoxin subunit
MSEVFVAKVSEFAENDRRIVRYGEVEVGVLHRSGEFFAYNNYCIHQGGPACEGMMIAKVEDVLAPDRTSLGLRFSKDEVHFVCPWHGYEYDIKTGECVADRRKRLRKFNVVVKGDSVYVVI